MQDAGLQRDEAHVDKLQARDLKNGSLSPAEKAQLTAAQDKASRDIHEARTNGINGNPSGTGLCWFRFTACP